MLYFEYIVEHFNPSFVCELMIAEGLIVFRYPHRKFFLFKLLGAIGACVLVSALFPVIDVYLSLVRYGVLFFITVLGVWFCFDCKFPEALSICLGGYMIQFLAFSLYYYTAHIIGVSGSAELASLRWQLIKIGIFAVVYCICSLIILLKITDFSYSKRGNIFLIPAAALFVVSVVINIFMVAQWFFDYLFNLYPIISCIVALFLLFGVQKINQLQSEREKSILVARKDKEHYDLYKASVEALNIKFHDMKHLLATIKNGGGFEGYVDDAYKSLSAYDSIAHTGNKALDVVLTEKKFFCDSKAISFTYMADGKLLDFLGEADLYSLLGNALDNAIENVQKVSEELRIINLSVVKQDGIVKVHVDNYYNGELKFKGGVPQTSKGDSANHGFGIKSMRLIAEKYGGILRIAAEDNVFNLNIVFPSGR